jgi:hypothetical protein
MSDAQIPLDAQRESGYMYYKVIKKGSRVIPLVWLNGGWKRSTTKLSDIMKMALIRPYKEGEISDTNNMVLQQSKNVRAVPEEILPLKSSSRRKRHRQSGDPVR